jgi:hypothetical protein
LQYCCPAPGGPAPIVDDMSGSPDPGSPLSCAWEDSSRESLIGQDMWFPHLELPRELTGLTLRSAWPPVLNRTSVWNVLNGRLHFPDRGAIAQLGERLDRTQEVAGSSPASSIFRIDYEPRPASDYPGRRSERCGVRLAVPKETCHLPYAPR